MVGSERVNVKTAEALAEGHSAGGAGVRVTLVAGPKVGVGAIVMVLVGKGLGVGEAGPDAGPAGEWQAAISANSKTEASGKERACNIHLNYIDWLSSVIALLRRGLYIRLIW